MYSNLHSILSSRQGGRIRTGPTPCPPSKSLARAALDGTFQNHFEKPWKHWLELLLLIVTVRLTRVGGSAEEPEARVTVMVVGLGVFPFFSFLVFSNCPSMTLLDETWGMGRTRGRSCHMGARLGLPAGVKPYHEWGK